MALVLNGSANTIGGLAVGGLPDGIVDAGTIAAEAVTSEKMGPDTIAQVKSTTKTNAFSSTSTSWTDVTGLSVNITPTTNSNKILVSFDISVGHNVQSQHSFKLVKVIGGVESAVGTNYAYSGNGTSMFYSYAPSAAEAGWNREHVTYEVLDAPATTSEITYKLQTWIYNSSYTQWVNRCEQDANTTGSSTITVKEVVA